MCIIKGDYVGVLNGTQKSVNRPVYSFHENYINESFERVINVFRVTGKVWPVSYLGRYYIVSIAFILT